MQGVTTALVAFIFFCVIFPDRVKSRAQFYGAFGVTCLIIILDAIGFAMQSAGFFRFAYFAIAFLQVLAILMVFMSAGGLSWGELKDEMGDAIEVIRRGEDKKEIIVPLTGAVPKKREDREVPVERIPLEEPPTTIE